MANIVCHSKVKWNFTFEPNDWKGKGRIFYQLVERGVLFDYEILGVMYAEGIINYKQANSTVESSLMNGSKLLDLQTNNNF